jgi:hypothetical protein
MSADVATQTVTVVYDPAKTNPQALADAITAHSEFKGSVKTP